jgi:hypothetical protein
MAEYTEAEKKVMMGKLKDMLIDSSSHLKQWIEQRLVGNKHSIVIRYSQIGIRVVSYFLELRFFLLKA